MIIGRRTVFKRQFPLFLRDLPCQSGVYGGRTVELWLDGFLICLTTNPRFSMQLPGELCFLAANQHIIPQPTVAGVCACAAIERVCAHAAV